jgi:hypothetical protein
MGRISKDSASTLSPVIPCFLEITCILRQKAAEDTKDSTQENCP